MGKVVNWPKALVFEMSLAFWCRCAVLIGFLRFLWHSGLVLREELGVGGSQGRERFPGVSAGDFGLGRRLSDGVSLDCRVDG